MDNRKNNSIKNTDGKEALLDRLLCDCAPEVPASLLPAVMEKIAAEKRRRERRIVTLRRFTATAAGLFLTFTVLFSLSRITGGSRKTEGGSYLAPCADEEKCGNDDPGHDGNGTPAAPYDPAEETRGSAPTESAVSASSCGKAESEEETGSKDVSDETGSKAVSVSEDEIFGEAFLSVFDPSGLAPSFVIRDDLRILYYFTLSVWDDRCPIEIRNPDGNYIRITVTKLP